MRLVLLVAFLVALLAAVSAWAGGGGEPQQQVQGKVHIHIPPVPTPAPPVDDGWTWPELFTAVGAAGTGLAALVGAASVWRRKRKGPA